MPEGQYSLSDIQQQQPPSIGGGTGQYSLDDIQPGALERYWQGIKSGVPALSGQDLTAGAQLQSAFENARQTLEHPLDTLRRNFQASPVGQAIAGNVAGALGQITPGLAQAAFAASPETTTGAAQAAVRGAAQAAEAVRQGLPMAAMTAGGVGGGYLGHQLDLGGGVTAALTGGGSTAGWRMGQWLRDVIPQVPEEWRQYGKTPAAPIPTYDGAVSAALFQQIAKDNPHLSDAQIRGLAHEVDVAAGAVTPAARRGGGIVTPAPPPPPEEQLQYGPPTPGGRPVPGTTLTYPPEATATPAPAPQALSGDEIARTYGYKSEQEAIKDVGAEVWNRVKAQGREAGRPVGAAPPVTEPPSAPAPPAAAPPTPPEAAAAPAPAPVPEAAEAEPTAKPPEGPPPGQRAPYTPDDVEKIMEVPHWADLLDDHVDAVVPPDEHPELNARIKSAARYYASQGEMESVADTLNAGREEATAKAQPYPPEHAPWAITTGEVPAGIAPEDVSAKLHAAAMDNEVMDIFRAAMEHETATTDLGKQRALAKLLGFGAAPTKAQLGQVAESALRGEEPSEVWTKLPNWKEAIDTPRVLRGDFAVPTDEDAINRALSGEDNTFITEERYQAAKKALEKFSDAMDAVTEKKQ